jgi:hypothetical protein
VPPLNGATQDRNGIFFLLFFSVFVHGVNDSFWEIEFPFYGNFSYDMQIEEEVLKTLGEIAKTFSLMDYFLS